MRRYDRSWPTAVTGIAIGGLLGFGLTASLIASSEERRDRFECECPPDATVRAEVVGKSTALPPPDRPTVSVAPGRMSLIGQRGAGLLVLRRPPLDYAAVEALLDDLRASPDVRARRRAAFRLGEVQDAKQVMGALMISLMTDEDRYVRANAAESLGRVGGATAVDPLGVAAREDVSARVRESAALGLGLTRHPLAIPVLLAVQEHDTSDDVRLRAARSLEAMGVGGSSLVGASTRTDGRR